MKILSLFLIICLLWLPVAPAHAQTETCDASRFVDTLTDDIAVAGEDMGGMLTASPEEVAARYILIMDTRHWYEDAALCDDLDGLRDLAVTLFTNLSDIMFVVMATQADPDNLDLYDSVLSQTVLTRNAVLLEAIADEAEALTDD